MSDKRNIREFIEDQLISLYCKQRYSGNDRQWFVEENERKRYHAFVFTDGSYKERPKPISGVGVFWGDDHPNNYSGTVHGRQCSNRAELCAAHHAIGQAFRQDYRAITVISDSTFVQNIIENPEKYEKPENAYFTDLIESIKMMRPFIKVKVFRVKAHAGNYGNIQADQLAGLITCTVTAMENMGIQVRIQNKAEEQLKLVKRQVRQRTRMHLRALHQNSETTNPYLDQDVFACMGAPLGMDLELCATLEQQSPPLPTINRDPLVIIDDVFSNMGPPIGADRFGVIDPFLNMGRFVNPELQRKNKIRPVTTTRRPLGTSQFQNSARSRSPNTLGKPRILPSTNQVVSFTEEQLELCQVMRNLGPPVAAPASFVSTNRLMSCQQNCCSLPQLQAPGPPMSPCAPWNSVECSFGPPITMGPPSIAMAQLMRNTRPVTTNRRPLGTSQLQNSSRPRNPGLLGDSRISECTNQVVSIREEQLELCQMMGYSGPPVSPAQFVNPGGPTGLIRCQDRCCRLQTTSQQIAIAPHAPKNQVESFTSANSYVRTNRLIRREKQCCSLPRLLAAGPPMGSQEPRNPIRYNFGPPTATGSPPTTSIPPLIRMNPPANVMRPRLWSPDLPVSIDKFVSTSRGKENQAPAKQRCNPSKQQSVHPLMSRNPVENRLCPPMAIVLPQIFTKNLGAPQAALSTMCNQENQALVEQRLQQRRGLVKHHSGNLLVPNNLDEGTSGSPIAIVPPQNSLGLSTRISKDRTIHAVSNIFEKENQAPVEPIKQNAANQTTLKSPARPPLKSCNPPQPMDTVNLPLNVPDAIPPYLPLVPVAKRSSPLTIISDVIPPLTTITPYSTNNGTFMIPGPLLITEDPLTDTAGQLLTDFLPPPKIVVTTVHRAPSEVFHGFSVPNFMIFQRVFELTCVSFVNRAVPSGMTVVEFD